MLLLRHNRLYAASAIAFLLLSSLPFVGEDKSGAVPDSGSLSSAPGGTSQATSCEGGNGNGVVGLGSRVSSGFGAIGDTPFSRCSGPQVRTANLDSDQRIGSTPSISVGDSNWKEKSS